MGIEYDIIKHEETEHHIFDVLRCGYFMITSKDDLDNPIVLRKEEVPSFMEAIKELIKSDKIKYGIL